MSIFQSEIILVEPDFISTRIMEIMLSSIGYTGKLSTFDVASKAAGYLDALPPEREKTIGLFIEPYPNEAAALDLLQAVDALRFELKLRTFILSSNILAKDKYQSYTGVEEVFLKPMSLDRLRGLLMVEPGS
ncbi:hypothetical protein [Pedobacter sp. SYSU D00535]|uniref:hypothetical protein n=1 Tax=Pedobacter sp. SYSU D00535 TaxID=2810308 RepID=UPI001A962137|nr:hypothetical protein [Pedobacter sp. SYSU D00535]